MDEQQKERIRTLALQLKEFPDKFVTLEDFDLMVDWNNPMPDDLVNLYRYKQELLYESLLHYAETNERRPAEVWLGIRFMEEFGFDAMVTNMFVFAGHQILYDRALSAMSDEEYEAHITLQEELTEAFMDENIFGDMNDSNDYITNREKEIQQLREMFGEG